MIHKEYPKTIILKKNIIIIAAIGLTLVVLLIFYNLYRNSHHQTTPNDANSQSSTSNENEATANNWYQNLRINKKFSAPKNPSNSPQVTTNSNNNDETKENVATQLGLDYQKAKMADISANQIAASPTASTTNVDDSNSSKDSLTPEKSLTSPHDNSGNSDQNQQKEKQNFILQHSQRTSDYLNSSLDQPISKYEIKTGTIIPAILTSGINSDLPGQIIGRVRTNVYDTVSGKYLLIPQGSNIIGLYDSQIIYGQERILIIWNRIIFPNGDSINLQGMPGVDLSGYAGFHDQVNNHYGKLFGSVLLLSIIGAGAQLSQPQQQFDNSGSLSVTQTLSADLGTNLANTANTITQKNINIQPTLEIRNGYLFNIEVTKDIVFPSGYNG